MHYEDERNQDERDELRRLRIRKYHVLAFRAADQVHL